MTARVAPSGRAAGLAAIDLYLGSSIGLWALRRFGRRRTGTVFTLDPAIAAEAAAMGLAVETGDPHDQTTGSPQAVSVHYPRILRADLLARYRTVYNLHPAFLPWGRGYFPVFWALWEGTPAGATLHLMAERLDAGPIVLQREVVYHDGDTGGSLHARVSAVERALLVEAWPTLGRGGDLPGTPQPSGGGYHSRAEFDRLHTSLKAEELSSAQLVRLARCLTFRGYPGLLIEANGVKVELAVGSVERLTRPDAPGRLAE